MAFSLVADNMVDDARTALEAQIAQEAKELKEAPVIKPIIGQVMRCHICGQCFSRGDLKLFDTHTRSPRLACPRCHPERTT
jgi:hypothetical protein